MPSISPSAVIQLIVDQQIVEVQEPLSPDSDLFAHGLDSLAMMQLMLHLESTFGVRIPPAEMTRNHFSTPTVLATWLSHPNRSAA